MAACVNVERMTSRLMLVTWLLTVFVAIVEASGISDLRLCGDVNCEKIISYARALGKYRQNDPIFLSFERDDIVRVLSKSAGQKPDLWGGEVHGKKGYFPRSFVKEYKVDIPNPQHTVKTVKELSIEERMRMDEEEDVTELGDDTDIDDDTEVAEEANDPSDDEKPRQEEPVQETALKEEVEADETEIDETELGDEDGEEEVDESADSIEAPSDKMSEEESDKDVFNFDRIKAKNILNHINEFDEDIFPILRDEDNDEKNKIEELNKILLTKSPTSNDKIIEESASGEETESTQQTASTSQRTDSTQQTGPPSQRTDSTEQTASTSQHTDSTQQTGPASQHTDSTQQAAPASQHTDSTQHATPPSQHTDSTQHATLSSRPAHSTQQTDNTPRQTTPEDKPAEEATLVTEEEVKTKEEDFDETDIGGGGDEEEDEEEESLVISDVMTNLKKLEQATKDDAAGKDRSLPEETLKFIPFEEEVKDSPKSEDLKEIPTSEENTKTEDIHEPKKQEDVETKSTSEDVQKEDVQKEDIQEDVQKEDVQKEDVQKEDVQKEDVQKEDVQKEDVQKEYVQKEDVQKEAVQKEEESNMKKASESIQAGHDHQETKHLDFVQAQVDDAMKKVETAEHKLEQPAAGVKVMEQPVEVVKEMDQTASGVKVMEQPTEGVKVIEQPAEGVKEKEQPVEDVKVLEQPPEVVSVMKQPSDTDEKEENAREEHKGVKHIEDPEIKETETTGSKKMAETESLNGFEASQQLLPSSASVLSVTQAAEPDSPPGYTVIDGTPFPLDLLDETDMDTASPVIEELKTRLPDQSSLHVDIVPTASFSKPIHTSADPSALNPSKVSNMEVPPFQEPVHSNIEESISQHPSFTVSEASSLSSSETTSLSDRPPLSADTTHGSQSGVMTENLHASASVSEQLLSSMDVSRDLEEKPSTEDIVSNRETVQQNLTHADSAEVMVPKPDSNQDMYATVDFLSRKVLSHDGSPGSMPSTNGANVPPVNQDGPDKQVQTDTLPNIDDTNSAPQNVDTGSVPNQQTDGDQGVTPPTTDSPNEIPLPPPVEDKPTATVPPWQKDTTDTLDRVDLTGKEGEYNRDPQWSRKINDEDIGAQEDKAFLANTWWVRTVRNMDARLKVLVVKLPPSVQSLLEQEPLGLSPQMAIFVTMVMTFTLFFVTCCGLFKGKKSKKKDPVLVVRSLEEQLFIMTKEKENLEDDLQSTKQKMKDLEKDLTVHQSSSGDLETELQNHMLHVDVLKQKLGILEQEKDKLTVDIEEKQRDAQSEHESASELHKQLIHKDRMLEELNDLQQRTNQKLSETLVELENYTSQLQGTSEQVQHLETRKQQLLQEVEGWKENAQDLSGRLDLSVLEQTKMQEDLDFKQNELEVLRDCFLQLKAFETEDDEDTDQIDSESIQEKFRSMLDVSKVKASLHSLEEEKMTLQNKVDIEVECRQEMEEQIACLQAKLESFQADKMKADRQSHESQTKLNVLTHYFKEKEVQLQRELGEQEALKKQNKNRLEHADERSKMVEAELDTYRTQAEDLKKEILSAERDFRSQIAANEKKAHENWLAARAAERELKESRHDSTVLRQKLTDLERRLHHGPSGLLRPLPTRGMPPPGMNGPPHPLPPGVDRPGSRGGGPPGPPGFRDGDFLGSPGPERMPPPPMHERRMPPPGVMGPRMPPPPLDGRSPPPYDRRGPPPPDRRSPPPYERGLRMPPPPHMDRRSPGYRMPPPDMLPRMRGPPPPHLRGGPTSPPHLRGGPTSPPPHGMGLPPDGRPGSGIHPYHPPPPGPDPDHKPRQQSQV